MFGDGRKKIEHRGNGVGTSGQMLIPANASVTLVTFLSTKTILVTVWVSHSSLVLPVSVSGRRSPVRETNTTPSTSSTRTSAVTKAEALRSTTATSACDPHSRHGHAAQAELENVRKSSIHGSAGSASKVDTVRKPQRARSALEVLAAVKLEATSWVHFSSAVEQLTALTDSTSRTTRSSSTSVTLRTQSVSFPGINGPLVCVTKPVTLTRHETAELGSSYKVTCRAGSCSQLKARVNMPTSTTFAPPTTGAVVNA
mmetsp:Transcript_29648/g.96911  ORF Transcript_29648/g.96911 Transcript_29648/m.96911 type:complete len:256 (-) Transcript_29648:172-939(-)